MYAKQTPVKYSPGGVFNPLMLLATKNIITERNLEALVESLHGFCTKFSSTYDLLLPPGVKGLKGVLEIFKE